MFRTDENKPFAIDRQKPEGAGFYSEGLSYKEFKVCGRGSRWPEMMLKMWSQVWMQLHPDQRQALESPVTVVKRAEQAAQYPVRIIWCIFWLFVKRAIPPTFDIDEHWCLWKYIWKGATGSCTLQRGIWWISGASQRVFERGDYIFFWFSIFQQLATKIICLNVLLTRQQTRLKILRWLNSWEQDLRYPWFHWPVPTIIAFHVLL